jgi:pimeloyl-ACP methyl ester carboxylesterase
MNNSIKPARKVRLISPSLCAVSLLFMFGAVSAQNQEPRVRNVVLVHGAWADGSGWKGVYDILVNDGYNVSIVQEPETSFKDDVAATKRVLAQQDGACILVAHSYGGAVITEAGTDPSVVWLGVCRGAHAGFWRERVGGRKALSKRPRQIGRYKEDPRRFHIYRPGAIS